MPKKKIIDEELLKRIPEGTPKERFDWLLRKMVQAKPMKKSKKQEGS